MQRDDATLLDIANAAQLITLFLQGVVRDDFPQDLKTQSAVLHQLMVIGEAVKRLSPDLRAAHPEIPWSLMAGMRDRLIHGYDSIDLDQVWVTAVRDIPELVRRIAPLLPQRSES